MSTPNKKLPLGVASFSTIRENNCYYVDKTHLIHQLLQEPWLSRFLSRPRRFGKSLFLDTIQSLYEGRQDLFEGLYIYDKWDWSKTHPVVKLDFSEGGAATHTDFRTDIFSQIKYCAETFHCDHALSGASPGGKLASLIKEVYRRSGEKVVVLIDEYDAPLIAMKDLPDEYLLTHTDLRGILKTIKSNRDRIEFVFMTGILKLDQHEFFSAANIFEDISLSPEYNDICGYTEEELLHTFKPEFERHDLSTDITIDTLREWYDGYRWGASTHLYNPLDILKTFKENKISDWWTTYGLTTIAIDKIKQEQDFTFENYTSSTSRRSLERGLSLSSKNISLNTILFQTGYLTLRSENNNEDLTLEPPNLEVKQSLARLRISIETADAITDNDFDDLLTILKKNDFEAFHNAINHILSKIIYDEKPEELRERHFSILMRSMFLACGLSDIHTEVHTQHGRADMVVYYRPTNTYYVMEFKVLGVAGTQPGAAMTQLKSKNYDASYKKQGRVFLLGFEFSVTHSNDNTPKVTLTNLDYEACH